MKIACLSDLHGHLPDLSALQYDLLVIAGDITPHIQKLSDCLDWLDNQLRNWLLYKPCIAIAGNHDFIFEQYPQLVQELALPWTYLCNSSAELDGLKVWGSPYSLPYGRWAFMANEDRLAEMYKGIPDDTDVIISHGPPYSKGDRVLFSDHYDEHVGSHSLLTKIRNLSPKLVVTGHIHESYGEYTDCFTTIINASLVDFNYNPVNPIRIIEINNALPNN